jgi:ribosome-associated protein
MAPRKKPRASKTASRDTLRPLVEAAAMACLEKKAQELVVLDVRPLSVFTDYHVICHAASGRQVQAVARFVEETLARMGRSPRAVEGFPNAEWVLLDYGSFLVHVFLGGRRRHYDLESLWGDAERVEVEAAHA